MIIKNICVCKHNKKRVNVYDEEGFAFSCYLDTVFNYDLKKDKQLTDDQMREIIHGDEVKFATDAALKLLGVRLRSEQEIRRSLNKKEVSSASIDEVIENLYNFELLNDEEFAEAYAKELAGRYGEKMVAKKLTEKGISISAAEKTAAKYKSSDTLKLFYERAKTKFSSGTKYETEQKIIRSLINKGFGYDEIRRMINYSDEE